MVVTECLDQPLRTMDLYECLALLDNVMKNKKGQREQYGIHESCGKGPKRDNNHHHIIMKRYNLLPFASQNKKCDFFGKAWHPCEQPFPFKSFLW